MNRNRYHVFYIWAYGMQKEAKVFDNLSDVLALVKEANQPESPYIDFTVIYGERLDFEPYQEITSWRIKEASP